MRAGILLRIRPFVAGDGQLIIDISPEVSDVIAVDAQGAPVVATRRVQTIVRCHEGETVVLGGLTQIIEKLRHSKVPVLGDIPLIGGLFRERRQSTEETELVIFLRPHILDNGIPNQQYFGRDWPEIVGPSEREAQQE